MCVESDVNNYCTWKYGRAREKLVSKLHTSGLQLTGQTEREYTGDFHWSPYYDTIIYLNQVLIDPEALSGY